MATAGEHVGERRPRTTDARALDSDVSIQSGDADLPSWRARLSSGTRPAGRPRRVPGCDASLSHALTGGLRFDCAATRVRHFAELQRLARHSRMPGNVV